MRGFEHAHRPNLRKMGKCDCEAMGCRKFLKRYEAHGAFFESLYNVVVFRRAFKRSKVLLTRTAIQSEPVGIALVSKVGIFLRVTHIPHRVCLRENNAKLTKKKEKQINNLLFCWNLSVSKSVFRKGEKTIFSYLHCKDLSQDLLPCIF